MTNEIYISPSLEASLKEAEIPTPTAIEVVEATPVVETTTTPVQNNIVVEQLQALPPMPTKKPMSDKMKTFFCKSLVNAFDVAQEYFFSNAAEKKFDKRLLQYGKDTNYLYELLNRDDKEEFTQDEKNIKKLHLKFVKFYDGLPLKENDKDELTEILKQYMIDEGIEFSPAIVGLVSIVTALTQNFIALKNL